MVSLVYAWVKNLVCFYIFLTVILRLLPRNNYQKYVRFFSGMLLMLLVFSPILSLLGKEDTIRQKISQAGFFQDMDNLKLDTAHLQQAQKEAYLREYERAVGMDVSRMAEEKQLYANQVEVHLSESYQVESIAMDISLAGGEGIFIRKASYGDNSQEYPEVYRLKQELMEFYKITESQIEINVQEG
ncbi:MAG: stage III sporulation protein AF [Lachnospiraceae bacterium]|jgi:stage III sporulation protein AF|nr:stage III sporulation protein AF [Lachnospiraceae bacterium]